MELPDFTVATTEFDEFKKSDGTWYSHYAYPHFPSDEAFFAEHPDALIVALPTVAPLTRNNAIVMAFLQAPADPGPDGDYGLKGVT